MRNVLAVFSLLFVLPFAAFAATPSVAALAETYENPVLANSTKVQNLTVQIGHLTLDLTGDAAQVMAGDQQIGMYFSGKGKMTYVSAEPLEAGIVMLEARKASDLTAEKSGQGVTLSDEFSSVYIRSGGVALPPLTGGGAPLDAAFAKHREQFGKARWKPATHLLIRQRIDAPTAPVAFIEFGPDDLVAYEFDSIDKKAETLASLRRNNNSRAPELRGAFFPVTISEQPVGRDRKAFVDPPFLLTNLDYTLIAEQDETAKLSVTETLTARNKPLSVVRLSLYSDTFDTNGKKRIYKVSSVVDAAGKPLPFHHADGEITVGLPSKIGPNQSATLKFEIAGDFLYRPAGDSYWQLGTEPWFPQPDLNGQYYTIHSVIKQKKPWIAFAPGETVRRAEEGDYNVVENRIDKPVQFAVALGGRYHFDESTEDGLTIRVATYALKNENAMKKLSNLARKTIAFYDPILGPFPFKEFNIIEIHELGWGQAPPATMFITKEAFNPLQNTENQFYSRGVNHRFAHEIAHQYWGHVVKMGSGEEQWVTEGFAEYSSSFATQAIKGKGARESLVSEWRSNAKDSTQFSPIPFANRLYWGEDYMGFVHRTHLIYDKGAYLLAVIHRQLGDDKFFTFLRSTQKFFEWKYLTTNDIARVLQRVEPGTDWNDFFAKHYWGTELPELPKK